MVFVVISLTLAAVEVRFPWPRMDFSPHGRVKQVMAASIVISVSTAAMALSTSTANVSQQLMALAVQARMPACRELPPTRAPPTENILGIVVEAELAHLHPAHLPCLLWAYAVTRRRCVPPESRPIATPHPSPPRGHAMEILKSKELNAQAARVVPSALTAHASSLKMVNVVIAIGHVMLGASMRGHLMTSMIIGIVQGLRAGTPLVNATLSIVRAGNFS